MFAVNQSTTGLSALISVSPYKGRDRAFWINSTYSDLSLSLLCNFITLIAFRFIVFLSWRIEVLTRLHRTPNEDHRDLRPIIEITWNRRSVAVLHHRRRSLESRTIVDYESWYENTAIDLYYFDHIVPSEGKYEVRHNLNAESNLIQYYCVGYRKWVMKYLLCKCIFHLHNTLHLLVRCYPIRWSEYWGDQTVCLPK